MAHYANKVTLLATGAACHEAIESDQMLSLVIIQLGQSSYL